MKIKFSCLSTLLSLLFLYLPLFGETGESGVPTLMMDSFGAREMSLGDTFVGVADDINTISVNPAGLNTLGSTEVSITYMKYFLDMNFGYVSAGTPLPRNLAGGYVAASVSLFNLPDFDQYDALGNQVDQKLSASDFIATLGYANNPLKLFGMNQNFSLGFNVKYIQSRLVEVSKSGIGFDMGALYRLNFIHFGRKGLNDNLGIGIAVQNIGSALKYEVEDTPLPRNLKFGIGYHFYADSKNTLMLSTDVNLPNDSNMLLSAGLEYVYANMIAIRAGYKTDMDELGHISFGIGARYGLSSMTLGLDYSLIPVPDLGTKHIISLNIQLEKERETPAFFSKEERGTELTINIGEYEAKLFQPDKTEIKKDGYRMLDEMTELIENEDYRRVIINAYKFREDPPSRGNLSEKRAKVMYDYFIQKGVDRERIIYKVYTDKKPTLIKSEDESKLGRLEIVIVRWREGEEDKFKTHYFNGLDAYLKEGYQEAINEWEKALTIDPENEDVKKRLKEAREALNKKNK